MRKNHLNVKRILAIFMLVVCIVSVMAITGCESSGEKVNGKTAVDSIVEISSSNNSEAIFVDQDTGVMYLLVKRGYGVGLTPLLNADGTPKLYEQWKNQQ